MAIAFKAVGTGHATATSGAASAPTCPATVDPGDILIAHVGYGNATTEIATPAGWTDLVGGTDPATPIDQSLGGTTVRSFVFGKIAVGDEDGDTLTLTPNENNTARRIARVYSYSGYIGDDITDAIPAASLSGSGHASDPQGPSVTTTREGALAVAFLSQADNNAVAAIAGATGGTWTESAAEYAPTTPGVGLMTVANHCTPTSDPGTVSGGAIAAANDFSWTVGLEIRPAETGDVFIEDSFTDTDATNVVTGHTSEEGDWQDHPSWGDPLIAGNRAHGTGSFFAVNGCTNTVTPPSADYEVEVVMRLLTDGTCFVVLRSDGTSMTNGYQVGWQSGAGFSLQKRAAGSGGNPDSGAVTAYNDTAFGAGGVDRTLIIRVEGTTISYWVDGTLRGTATDDDFSSAGLVGFFHQAGFGAQDASNGVHIDSIIVRELPGADEPPPPSTVKTLAALGVG